MIALRGYQGDGVAATRLAYLNGASAVCYISPTGSGKTIVFAYILASAVERGRRVLILVHRVELIDQVAAAIKLAGVSYGVIAPGFPESDALVQIASVASLARPKRLERWRGRFDFIVIDECHHAVAGSWAKVLASQPSAKILGVTATPERLDGKGLGEVFDDLVIGPSTAELIAAGWLSHSVAYEPAAAPDVSGARIRGGDYAVEDLRDAMDGVVIGAAVTEYQRICADVPAVAFCVDVAHSRLVAERFLEAGVRAQHVDGETPPAERRAAIAALGSGDLDVITNCNLFGEGVDIPSIGAVLLLRPTLSLALYLQQVGRGLRPSPGKQLAILDFGGNVARHGHPDAKREWSLEAKPRRQRELAEGPQLRRCPACSVLNRPGVHECSECGADLRTHRERVEVEMALREARQRELEDMLNRMLPRERITWAGADEGRLRLVGQLNGFRPGWAYWRRKELAGLQVMRAAAGDVR